MQTNHIHSHPLSAEGIEPLPALPTLSNSDWKVWAKVSRASGSGAWHDSRPRASCSQVNPWSTCEWDLWRSLHFLILNSQGQGMSRLIPGWEPWMGQEIVRIKHLPSSASPKWPENTQETASPYTEILRLRDTSSKSWSQWKSVEIKLASKLNSNHW